MWLVLLHAHWPVGYNSIDTNGQIVNVITQERIVLGRSNLVKG